MSSTNTGVISESLLCVQHLPDVISASMGRWVKKVKGNKRYRLPVIE